MRTRRR